MAPLTRMAVRALPSAGISGEPRVGVGESQGLWRALGSHGKFRGALSSCKELLGTVRFWVALVMSTGLWQGPRSSYELHIPWSSGELTGSFESSRDLW